MLTHWDTLSVSSELGVQKAVMAPVFQEGGGDHRAEPSRDRTATEGRGLVYCQSVLPGISFFPAAVSKDGCFPVLQPSNSLGKAL